ncbi:MAG: hypothetical protein KF691_01950 [Phycisphaeraceae bacterium]|nr:hypothetical protein [Phycisphaeraceae bacterium]
MQATDSDRVPAPLRFERRRAERSAATGSAVVVFQRANRAPLLSSVRIADSGPGGLGVYCDADVKPGTAFQLYPDDPSQMRRAGRVVGCVRVGKSFRLGLQLQQALAA